MIFGTLSFDLKDAIDIILVALLLFYIYRLMRASSSSNIFTGVLVSSLFGSSFRSFSRCDCSVASSIA